MVARTRSTIARIAALLLLALPACRGGGDTNSARTLDRLVAVGDGVVLDQRTGLQWTNRDHDQALAWENADRYCRELALGGGTGWRLPEIDELRALYDEKLAAPCGDRTCHLDPTIRLADPYVWSASTRGPGTRFYFDFTVASSLSPGIGPRLVRRVLCVRQAP